MQIERERLVREKTHLDIQGITLLSVEECEKHKQHIKSVGYNWWLRSPGIRSKNTAIVDDYGRVYSHGYYVDSYYAVRPALQIANPESAGLKIGDSFCLFDYRWTVISDGLALCDKEIARRAFREDWKAEDANDYEKSDVKRFLEEWFDERCKEEAAR